MRADCITILFVALTICTSKNLVITNETTNTIMPIISARVVPIVPSMIQNLL